MKPSNWIIALCATGAHNYAAIIASILISTALVPSLATARERRSGGDESPAAVEQHGDFVTVATWYGPGYEGRKTTNGEIFDSSKLTAASLVLPLGSHVTVTSLNNGRSVTVRINDCGSHLRTKIDLSRAAAQRISSIKNGIVPVRIRILDVPKHARLCTARRVELSAASLDFLSYELASLDSPPSPLP
jgi:rare lipoprotein A (peptidoglycan hydrolase)